MDAKPEVRTIEWIEKSIAECNKRLARMTEWEKKHSILIIRSSKKGESYEEDV